MSKRNNLQKKHHSDILPLILSFCIPALILFFCFVVKEVYPFGEFTLCSMDGFSQYYPMLMNMTEAVKDGEVFYSFNGALGFNLWAQSAYYTNSLFWLPLYFIPHESQINYIHFTILFKLSLAGLLFCFRLLKTNRELSYRRKLLFFPALSTAWALSGYMSAFINQLMWTDVVVFLPMVILGIEYIKEKEKPALYILFLFLSIISCFYLSFMVCIFAVLYFFYLFLKEKSEWKDFFRKAVIFGISSLTAGGMSAVVILPVYKALGLTKASSITFDGDFEIIYSFLPFLKRFLPFQSTSLEYDEPNLYCTLTVVLIFILFLFSKKFTVRHRVAAFCFMTFMMVTMSVNLGEFIWHGFHYPNQLPARQSFLAIFLLLAFAGEFLSRCTLSKKALCTLMIFVYLGAGINFLGQFCADVWISRVSSLQKFENVMAKFTPLDKDDTFARLEWTGVKKNNYPQQYSYKGVGYYSSTMSEDAYDFFQNMGMERYARNVSVHYKESDILNAVFSIRYILSGDNAEHLTVNENILPLGFLSSISILDFVPTEENKGDKNQQLFWDSLCGKENADFETGFSILSENPFKTEIFDTDYIKGSINCNSNGIFFTSIPYDEGWKILIDGTEVETKKVAGYFLACPLEKGEHEVTLTYTVPGIKAGAVISLVSLAGYFALIYVFSYKKSKKEKNS